MHCLERSGTLPDESVSGTPLCRSVRFPEPGVQLDTAQNHMVLYRTPIWNRTVPCTEPHGTVQFHILLVEECVPICIKASHVHSRPAISLPLEAMHKVAGDLISPGVPLCTASSVVGHCRTRA